MEAQESHRPGTLKQQNKSHKTGRHRSKGSIQKGHKGKVNLKTITKRTRTELSKVDRRHQLNQIRKNKRDEVMTKKRSLGGTQGAPFLIAVVALGEDIDPNGAIELLKQADVESIIKVTTQSNVHISVPRFKQRFSIVTPRFDNLNAILDTLKVADTALFLTSVSAAEDGLGEEGEEIMTAALAQRLPTPILAVIDLDSVAIKKRNETKQAIQDLFSRWLPGEKAMSLASTPDALALLRRVGGQKRRSLIQRDRRSHLVAEHVEMAVSQGNPSEGTLKVEGFVRGQPLSPDFLVHVPGLGEFRVAEIELLSDPTGSEISRKLGVFLPDPQKQEPLQAEAEVDPMDAEQTWPTEEEIREAEVQEALKRPLKKVRVPRGMSDYQASWIPDEGEDGSQDSEDDSETDDPPAWAVGDAVGEDEAMMVEEGDSEGDDDEEDDDDNDEGMSIAEPEAERYDAKMDAAEEEAARLAASEDARFPDEVDTPFDVPARERFHKYRGLQSFRTSAWDPRENLPPEFARIFQFESYDRMRRQAFRLTGHEAAAIGSYVRVHLAAVPVAAFGAWRIRAVPLALVSMAKHEQRMSQLNLVVRNATDQPIPSKTSLVFHVGYRRFKARPIFSQHTNGNKHKCERFWQPGATVVASMLAPVMFSPATVLVFSEDSQTLVGTGDVLSADPNRIVVKRVVLSGHPLKVHKRSAVIRFMFSNREDIAWFKPVELATRLGRRGHIKEPLGTHGHMKCVFDTQLKSQDTVFMRLYKRVFPPWSFENLTDETP